MNVKEVCQLFANQSKPKVKASNLYFDGRVAYSYGAHFPLAVIMHAKYKQAAINASKYSPSTSRHQSEMHAALQDAGYTLFEFDTVQMQTLARDIPDARAQHERVKLPLQGLRRYAHGESILQQAMDELLLAVSEPPEFCFNTRRFEYRIADPIAVYAAMFGAAVSFSDTPGKDAVELQGLLHSASDSTLFAQACCLADMISRRTGRSETGFREYFDYGRRRYEDARRGLLTILTCYAKAQ